MDPARHVRRLGRALSRASHGTRERPVLKALYETTVSVESVLARLVHSPRRVSPAAPASLTLVIKTFERPDVLRRMLASVRRVYSGPIIVADDSQVPFATEDPLVTVLALPFDSGVGAGRNALLDAVTTEYLWMADDDMVLLPDLDVARAVAYLDRNPQVDLVGGRVVNLPLWRTADYGAAALFAYEGTPRLLEGTIIDGLPVLYKVPNFYVARADAVRSVRYDERLKRVDHNDFFTSAHGRLVCTYDRDLVCLHAHAHFDAHYQSFRMDSAPDLAYLAEKWRGRGASRTATGQPVEAWVLRVMHHAAVQTVADDLRVPLVHDAREPVTRVVAPRGERDRLVDGLVQLGWSRRGQRLLHPLWGEAAVEVGEPGRAVTASFAGVGGLALEAGKWPSPEGSATIDGSAHPLGGAGEGRVAWAERIGWLNGDARVWAATLPKGPVVSLDSPADAIWEAIGPSGRRVDEVVQTVLARFPGAPAEAEGQIREVLRDLTERGLLRRA